MEEEGPISEENAESAGGCLTTENTLQADLELDISKAITVIKADNNANSKHLQQRLKLSYGRAAEILAHLEKEGIVGPAQGGQPRVIDFAKLNKAALSISSALTSAVVPEPPFSPVADVKVSPPAQVIAPETLIPSADATSDGQGSSVCPSREADESNGVATKLEESHHDGGVVEQSESNRLVAGSNPALGPTLRFGICAYLPPPRFNTLAFLENLKRNPPAHELVTFSDDPSFKPTVLMKRSIEIPSLKEKQHGIANLAFYLAFGIAWKRGFTHFLYAEADIRVRSVPIQTSSTTSVAMPWDEQILCQFNEAQSERAVPLIVGGHMMLHNPFKPDPETAQRANELLAKWNPKLTSGDVKERNREVPVYGARKRKAEEGSGVGCNGAGAIYSVEGLRTLFPEIKEPGDTATMVGLAGGWPFDFETARRNWRMHKAGAFDRVAHLSCVFSIFGDTLSTEQERMDMLRSGQRVLIHQCKSEIAE